jgi:hypothetical protein
MVHAEALFKYMMQEYTQWNYLYNLQLEEVRWHLELKEWYDNGDKNTM